MVLGIFLDILCRGGGVLLVEYIISRIEYEKTYLANTLVKAPAGADAPDAPTDIRESDAPRRP